MWRECSYLLSHLTSPLLVFYWVWEIFVHETESQQVALAGLELCVDQTGLQHTDIGLTVKSVCCS